MSESPKKKKAGKSPKGPKRIDRRFVAQSGFNPWIVRVAGGLGAMALGSGAWGYLYGASEEHLFVTTGKLAAVPSYLVAGGAILTGIAIWLGTATETPIRVGAPGVGVEKGDVRRMPWYGLKSLTWESGSESLVLNGEDESGSSWTFKVPRKSHGEAVGWILREAEERVPKVIDIDDNVRETLPRASTDAGQRIELEPLQVVGKRDAIGGKTISYEPDARVCVRCERVYDKKTVPKKCKCGAALGHLRGAGAGEGETEEEEAES